LESNPLRPLWSHDEDVSCLDVVPAVPLVLPTSGRHATGAVSLHNFVVGEQTTAKVYLFIYLFVTFLFINLFVTFVTILTS
jgi:hypothetical protein